MVTVGVLMHVVRTVKGDAVRGKRVLEVGSLDHNGGIRDAVMNWEPAEYVGVDMMEGPGVDRVCRVEDLENVFGPESFDVVVATELLEHVRGWKMAVHNLKAVLKVGGLLVVTTPSPGFPYHGYPHDYWRFTREDFQETFWEFADGVFASDSLSPGIFFSGVRTVAMGPILQGMAIPSFVLNRRVLDVSEADTQTARWRMGIRRAKLADMITTAHALAHKAYHFPSSSKEVSKPSPRARMEDRAPPGRAVETRAADAQPGILLEGGEPLRRVWRGGARGTP